MTTEQKRQYVHILLFLFAFILKYLNQWQAFLLVLSLLAFTLLVLPKLKYKKHFYRPSETIYSEGAVIYFAVLLILTIFAPLYIVAAAWVILALGDGMATLVGKHFKAKELPWNHKKTFAGFLAFFIFATLGCFVILKWMAGSSGITLGSGDLFLISLETSLIAAVVESLPIKINDNLSITIASAAMLAILL